MLSACSDGSVYIHDLNNFTGRPNYTATCVCKVAKNNENAHKYSVECATWYGNDNELFITSGTDKLLKIWDANSLKAVENFKSKGRIFHHCCSPIPTSNPIVAGKFNLGWQINFLNKFLILINNFQWQAL